MTITEHEKGNINFSIYAVRQNEHAKTIHSIGNCIDKLQSYDKKISRLACKNRLENKLQMWENVRAAFGTIGYYLSKNRRKDDRLRSACNCYHVKRFCSFDVSRVKG